jgi:hypothetical protein
MSSTLILSFYRFLVVLGLLSFCLAIAPLIASSSEPLSQGEVSAEIQLPARIDRIEWLGNSKTQDYVLLRELPWKPGEEVSLELFQIGLSNIETLSFIMNARGHVVRRAEENVAMITVSEKFSINAIFSAQAAGSSYWLDLGLGERNLLGRSIELSGIYENFDGVQGGRLWIRDPRLFNSRFDASLKLEELVRPRPEAAVQRVKVRPELDRLSQNRQLLLGGALEVFKDSFYQPLTNDVSNLPSPTTGAFLEPFLRLGQIYRSSLRLSGRSVELNPQLGFYCLSGNACTPYVQANVTGRVYWMPEKLWNLLMKVKIGATTGVPFEMQYYFGGVDYLRGYVDNYVATVTYVLYNFDLRYTLFEWQYLAIQPYFFTDGIIYNDGVRFGAPTPGGVAFTSGVGLNCSIPKFVDSALRFEMSFPFQTLSGPTFGVSTVVLY